ncbi:flavodoxin family protein [Rugamonas sp. FT82W]|uniref:FMN dependent NADH:quinone oxidoreductase n=1 Tax=Duganella vulcania TaxID=2692166 RepID=A0A845G5P0_9BURK|nr:NAD(P)H-dependent oxidoreductase [Duganella vulcania]MYM89171.1 flavodoxin family protein [Duganella vulcania]
MKILHITCSPRGPQSVSYRLSQRVMDRLLTQHPAAQIVTRDLCAEPLPHIDGEYATALGGGAKPANGRAASSLALSDRLIAELRDADYVVIATPMHNFTVPSVLKAWLDHVVRIGVTFNATPEGKVGTLADRPVYIAVSSGGYRSGERARQPDFLEPYLRALLPTIGLKNLSFLSVQATASGPEAVERELGGQFAAA